MTLVERFHHLTPPISGELKQRSIRGGVVSLSSEAIDFVIRVTTISILARLLVPEHFGLISMATAIIAVADRFKDLGLSMATVREPTITHAQVSTLFWINTAVGAGTTAAVAALAPVLGAFYGDHRLVWITLSLSVSFLFGGAAIQHQALLRRQMMFGRIAAVNVVSSLLSVILAVVVALKGGGYWALVVREVARPLFAMCGTWLCFPWIPGWPTRQSGVRAMLSFGGDVTAFNLVYFFASSIDQILIGKVYGPSLLGYYRQGVQLILSPVTQLTYPVSFVSESALSRLVDDHETYRRYYRKILAALSLLSMPFAAFIVVYSREIVLIALGPKWLPATEVFRIMALAAFLRPALSTTGAVLMSTGHSRRFFWLGLLTSVSLVASFAGGLHWGITGVAYGHIVSTLVTMPPKLYWSYKDTPVAVRTFFSAIWRPFVASISLGTGLALLHSAGLFVGHPLEVVALGALIGGLLYLTCLCLLPGGRAELHELTADLLPNLPTPLRWTPRKSEEPARP